MFSIIMKTKDATKTVNVLYVCTTLKTYIYHMVPTFDFPRSLPSMSLILVPYCSSLKEIYGFIMLYYEKLYCENNSLLPDQRDIDTVCNGNSKIRNKSSNQ